MAEQASPRMERPTGEDRRRGERRQTARAAKTPGAEDAPPTIESRQFVTAVMDFVTPWQIAERVS